MQEILLHHAFTFSPFVEDTAPGVRTIRFTDCRNLSAKMRRVVEQLAECKVRAQAAVAPTPDISFLAAHLVRPVSQIENAKEFLAPLPIEALAIPGYSDDTQSLAHYQGLALRDGRVASP